MPFYNPGPGAVQTAYVSYREVTLTEDLTLFWPNAFQATPNVMAAFMNFKTVSSPGLTVTLPDARQVSVGQNFIITNTSATTFNLLKNDGVFLAAIPNPAPPATNVFYIVLQDNTTAGGIWRVVGFGSTTADPVPSALAGPGLIADDGKLWTNAETFSIDTNPFTINEGRFNGKTFLWPQGTGTIDLDPTADATIETGFYFYLNTYQATGQVTITPTAGKTIDNATEKVMNPRQSLMIVLDDTNNWWSIGYAPSTTSNFSIINIPVTGGERILSATDASYDLIYVTGTLTSDCTLIFPSTNNSEWQVANMTSGGHSLFIELSGFPGSNTEITQGTANIFYSFGGNFNLMPTVQGSVTSVAISSTDLAVTGDNPITTAGTIDLALNTVLVNKGGTGQTTAPQGLKALMPTAVAGDIVFYNGALWVPVPAGTNGDVLTLVGGEPSWQPLPP